MARRSTDEQLELALRCLKIACACVGIAIICLIVIMIHRWK
jgi:hypothetical protein